MSERTGPPRPCQHRCSPYEIDYGERGYARCTVCDREWALLVSRDGRTWQPWTSGKLGDGDRVRRFVNCPPENPAWCRRTCPLRAQAATKSASGPWRGRGRGRRTR